MVKIFTTVVPFIGISLLLFILQLENHGYIGDDMELLMFEVFLRNDSNQNLNFRKRSYNWNNSENKIKDISERLENISFLNDKRNYFCRGSWQNQCYELKKGDESERILVAVPSINGLADRIAGLASVFLVSLLTERVFHIGRRRGLMPLETAFLSPSINWSRSIDFDWLIAPVTAEASILNGRNYNMSILKTLNYFAFNTIEDHRMQYKLTNRDIRHEIPKKYKTIFMSMNRGKTVAILANPYHKNELLSLGFKPDTAFGCIINYLLHPKPEIFLPIADSFMQMSDFTRSDNLLKIAIQIRVGDIVWSDGANDSIDIHNYSPYFSCAKQIEYFVRKERQSTGIVSSMQSLWYVVTDSLPLRRRIQQALSHSSTDREVVVDDGLVVEHSAKEIGVCKPNCGINPTVSEEGFRTAAAEWWMMGYADYHVITESSGFGRTAAMRARHSHSIYTIPPYEAKKGKQTKVRCGPKDFTTLQKLSTDWSGI